MRDNLHKANIYDNDPFASHQPIRWLYLIWTDPEPILWSILILHFLMHSFLISQTTCPYLELKVVHASNYLNYPEKAVHSLNIFHLPSILILPSFDSLLHVFYPKSYMLLIYHKYICAKQYCKTIISSIFKGIW